MVFLCVHADHSGFVDMTLDACGKVLGWSEEELHSAGDVLLTPDPDSTSPLEEGRRITARSYGSRGVQIVNYDSYRSMQSESDRKEYMARYYRERLKPMRRNKSTSVKNRQSPSGRSVEAEADTDTEADKSVDDRVGTSSSLLDLEVLTTSGQSTSEELTSEEAFDRIFWPEYPRKTAKEAARKAWRALKLGDRDQERLDSIMLGLRRDVAQEWKGREPDKIPHASTWLNQKRWQDGA